MKIGVHFSDIFNVSRDALENYGAFNISLIADMPLFIDPFLLFSSDKPEYQALHKQILDYLSFLKIKADAGITDEGLIYSWYTFPERKQNWFGYSQLGNSGRGLGRYFALNMHTVTKVNKILRDLNLDNKPNVILIDARMKKSASKVDAIDF